MAKKKKNEITIRSSAAEYLTFIASIGDSQNSFEIRYEDENIWLTQKTMATLYDVETHTINYHIKKIVTDSELEESSVIRRYRITAADGKPMKVNAYLLCEMLTGDNERGTISCKGRPLLLFPCLLEYDFYKSEIAPCHFFAQKQVYAV